MKKIVSGLILLFVSFAAFCQSDKKPCSLTEAEEEGHLVRKGEMNYLSGNYKELRLSIQFQMIDNNMYVCIGMDLPQGDTIYQDNLAYIQFEDGKECVLTPDIVRKDKGDPAAVVYEAIDKAKNNPSINRLVPAIVSPLKIRPKSILSSI